MEYVETLPPPLLSLNPGNSWGGTEAPPSLALILCLLSSAQENPCCRDRGEGSHSAFPCLMGKVPWGNQRHLFACTVKPTWKSFELHCLHCVVTDKIINTSEYLCVVQRENFPVCMCYSFPLPFYWPFVGMQAAKEKPDFLPVIHL